MVTVFDQSIASTIFSFTRISRIYSSAQLSWWRKYWQHGELLVIHQAELCCTIWWRSVIILLTILDYSKNFRTILRLLLFLRAFHLSYKYNTKTLKRLSVTNKKWNDVQLCCQSSLLMYKRRNKLNIWPTKKRFTYQWAVHLCAIERKKKTPKNITLITSEFAFLVHFAEQRSKELCIKIVWKEV